MCVNCSLFNHKKGDNMTTEQLAFSSKYINDPAFSPHRASAVIISTFTDPKNNFKYYSIKKRRDYSLNSIAKDFKINTSEIWLNEKNNTYTIPFRVAFSKVSQQTQAQPKNISPKPPTTPPNQNNNSTDITKIPPGEEPKKEVQEDSYKMYYYIGGGLAVGILIVILVSSNHKNSKNKKIKKKR